jgi:ATP-dependent helicase/nuclease subunit A
MLEHIERAKERMRVRDFDDLELGVAQMISDPHVAAYWQARLDARYRHILIDEFQDTNPLQWQILRAWLAAYGEDHHRFIAFVVRTLDYLQPLRIFYKSTIRLTSNSKIRRVVMRLRL